MVMIIMMILMFDKVSWFWICVVFLFCVFHVVVDDDDDDDGMIRVFFSILVFNSSEAWPTNFRTLRQLSKPRDVRVIDVSWNHPKPLRSSGTFTLDVNCGCQMHQTTIHHNLTLSSRESFDNSIREPFFFGSHGFWRQGGAGGFHTNYSKPAADPKRMVGNYIIPKISWSVCSCHVWSPNYFFPK